MRPSRRRPNLLVFPRDANPYQSRLDDALGRTGVRSHYIGDLSPSHSINLLLLPLELAWWRLRGARVLHLHWVFGFAFTGAEHRAVLRRASYAWYLVVLACARLTGIHIVWTLHNVLPHQQVFPDDRVARRRLLRAASLVIAHSEQALAELRRVVDEPQRAIVLPHPNFDSGTSTGRRNAFPRRVLVFGRITAYKGVEETIEAFDLVAAKTTLELTFAGGCPDPGLRRSLVALQARHPERVHLQLEHVGEDALGALFAAHDLQWLPYRRSTTSGAAVLGAQMGIPLAVPHLPAFDGVPGLRLGQDIDELAAGLRGVDVVAEDELRRLSELSLEWSAGLGTWDEMAQTLTHQIRAMTARHPPTTAAAAHPQESVN